MAKSAKNYTQLSKNVLDTEGMKKSSMNFFEMIEKKNISNIFLIVAIIAFVISISYSITVSQNTQSSQASEVGGQLAGDQPVITQTPQYKEPYLPEYPSFYKETPIPKELLYTGQTYYDETEEEISQTLITNNIIKYYIYHDVIQERGVPVLSATSNAELEEPPDTASLLQSSELISYTTIEPVLRDYTHTIDRTVLQNIDFYYLLVRYVQNNTEADQDVTKKLGKPQKEAALETITRYQKVLGENPGTVETVLKEASDDTTLTTLNGTSEYQNNIVTKYKETDVLLPGNDDFNAFVFSQSENQVSDIHEYTSPQGKKMGYIIILPTRYVQSEYKTEEDLISEYLEYFE